MTSKRPVDGSERRKTGRRSALKLHPTAEAARVEALEHLGDAAVDFTAAISRYVNAVNVAATARAEWERLDRPMMHRFWNGAEGIHPLIQTMERLDRAAAQFGASLGLDPMSARRLGRVGRLGRPAGANSAPDRWMPSRCGWRGEWMICRS